MPLTSLQSFCGTAASGCVAGQLPEAGLVQATDGNLYGTTGGGGTNSQGTVFKITPSGTLTTLYNFCAQSGCADGLAPYSTLIQTTNGDLYGTTAEGGVNGLGTIFKITLAGTLTTVYSFCSQSGCTDGASPGAEALVQVTNGDLYGTTTGGGSFGQNTGVIFSVTPAGSLTASFGLCTVSACTSGNVPFAGLIQATNGKFYGTTYTGGTNGKGGAVFQFSPNGTLKPLYDFCSQPQCTDGASPIAGLLQATDGNLYGTTQYGGNSNYCGQAGCGTLFKITATGALTTLYNFCSQSGCADGGDPWRRWHRTPTENCTGQQRPAGLTVMAPSSVYRSASARLSKRCLRRAK